MSLYALLREQASRSPDALALLAPARAALRYDALLSQVQGVTQALAALGLGRGDCIAVVLPNGPEMATCFLSVAACASCAPLNPDYREEEFDFYLRDLDARALIVQTGVDSPAVAAARARNLPILELLPHPEEPAGVFSLRGPPRGPPRPVDLARSEDLALLLHTSGTTSRPKLIPLTHENLCASLESIRLSLGLGPQDRCLNVMPLFHVSGLVTALLGSLWAGGSVVCTPGFDVERFFRWMEDSHPSWYTAVPTIHQMILEHADREVVRRRPLRFIRSGMMPISAGLVAALEALFQVPVIHAYGMTEAAALIASNPLPPRVRKPGSVGVPAGTTVAILDEHGALLPSPQRGEVVLQGPNVIRGYLRNPQANAASFVDGWFRTGDTGYIDADGYVFLTGRVKEIISKGGERISPGEVEECLQQHPAVGQAVAFPIPHVSLGEDIAAAVVLREGASATGPELRAFAAARLAGYKVPQQVLVVDSIPLSALGKVQRLSLAQHFAAALETRYQAPRTPAEERLAGLFAQVLGLAREQVGTDASFFLLGGQSLLATQLLARVREAFEVELALPALFGSPTVASLAALLEASPRARSSRMPPLLPVPRDAELPLSFSQQRLWFLEQLHPGSAAHNIPVVLRLAGPLEVDVLRRGLQELVQRHEALRTHFVARGGQASQVIAPTVTVTLPVVDLRALPAPEREAAAWRRLTQEAQRPFETSRGPLLRTVLLRLEEGDHFLSFCMHHLVSDGWSVELLLRELRVLYEALRAGQAPLLPPLPVQYADYAQWQRRWMQGEVLAEQLDYWRQRLRGPLPTLQLPTDFPRPAVQTFRGASLPVRLDAALTGQLQALAQQEGATLFMTLLAAFQGLLCRYSGQEDLLVAVPIAGRQRTELEGLVGLFVNTLALRTDCSGNPTFRELLGRVKEAALGAAAHQDLPFERLVEEVQEGRDPSRPPICQVAFVLQQAAPAVTRAADLTLTRVPVDTGTARLELALVLRQTEQGLSGELEYSADLFQEATVARLAGHLERLLRAVARDPQQRLWQLPLLTERERHQLLVEWSSVAGAPSGASCIHALFEAQATRTPDAVAVELEDRHLTYAELEARSNQLAHHLRALGVGPEALVGLCMERSLEQVVGLLGILKAGAAYVPLDPAYPRERLAFLLADTQVAVLLTQERLAARLPEHPARVVRLDADGPSIAARRQDRPEVAVAGDALAYVIYTSGSTGRPKGVLLQHQGLCHLIEAQLRDLDVRAEDRVLQFTSPGFDVSVLEIFLALCSGATLCLAPPRALLPGPGLIHVLRQRAITVAILPASVLAVLPPSALPALRTLVVGGEACPAPVVERWARGRRLFNEYGPTEATICASLLECTGGLAPPLIGRPTAHAQLYVLDATGQPAPIGVPGELHIGGPGLARGYLHRPELTAERFIAADLGASPAVRLYRTGDRVRWRADGHLEFLGRIDGQLKLRGFRIEPGEVEAVLEQHPALRRAAVVLREDVPGERRLVAYGETAPAASTSSGELRTFLKQRLPEYMVPSAFVLLDALPLGPHGKVDRAGLPPPTARPQGTAPAAAPGGALERTLQRIWREVLGVEAVGTEDNFFDLGGHSLLLPRVLALLQEALGRELSILELLEYPTIGALARHLAPASEQPPVPAAVSAPAARQEPARAGSIAIIGMSGRFPGARDLTELWRNLAAGVESISLLTDAELEAAGVAPALLARPDYVKAKGVLEGADLFDAAFFGYSPRDAEQMDPQQRIFLECAWEALEHAGYNPETHGASIGVFAGASAPTYPGWAAEEAGTEVDPSEHYQTLTGRHVDFLATRVSYKLDLRGPSLTLQSACSTSLVAVHTACRSLLQGDCALALAGGVSITVPLASGYRYQEGMIRSPDGHCRPFDEQAAGTLAGNGVGVVVLKRLSDALADGDTIHAVLLGSALTNDGMSKVGYTAPSIVGQAEAIARAQAAAGVSPDEVSYVEAHGTGTPLGDPIEVAALTRVFRARTQRQGFCALGSLKGNLGHLDAAAGIAGLLKTILCLEHRQLPPTLHFERPNPKLALDDSPFYVNTRLSEWPTAGGQPRRAGVSAFGIGGTNAHVVLEEAPAAPPSNARPDSWRLLVLSARTPRALAAAARRLRQHLAAHPESALADVAHTLQVGRKAFAHRLALTCRDSAEAVRALEHAEAGLGHGPLPEARGTPAVAFLFPGQGSQRVNMGRRLYQAQPLFRAEVDRCAELLRPHLGRDIRELLYPAEESLDAASEQLEQTAFAQVGLFVTEYALARLWLGLGLRPRALVGHSLGEYVAACLSGVFSLEEALRLVCARGRLMQEMAPGAMLSVPLPEAEVRPLLGESLSLAAVNGPSATVVSGPCAAVEALGHTLTARGVEVRPLRTSHAFHSAMMEPALARFEEEVRRCAPRAPALPLLSNLTGTWMTPEEATDPSYWARHLRQTVRFSENLQVLLEEPGLLLLEVGPGRALGALVHQHPSSGSTRGILSSLPDARAAARDEGEFFLAQLGRVWATGVSVAWPALDGGERRGRVPLPTYPFERQRYWAQGPGRAPRVPAVKAPGERPPPRRVYSRPPLAVECVAPRTPGEEAIARVWQEVLGVHPIGVHDDFYDLGGESLRALQLSSRLREVLQLDLSQQELLQRTTIAQLAALLDGAAAGEARGQQAPRSPLLVELQRGAPGRRPLFLIHPVGGSVFLYRALTRHLDPDQPVYALRAMGLEAGEALDPDLEHMAARYLAELRARQPRGPYLLGGSSFGGIVAYAMAQRLARQGERIERVFLLDSPGPGQMPKALHTDAQIVEYLDRMAPELFQSVLLHGSNREAALPEREVYFRLFRNNAEAMLRYAPEPYAGRVVFFRASERDETTPHHPEYAWIGLARGGIEIHEVPGNHLTMMAEPHVPHLAKRLQESLEGVSTPRPARAGYHRRLRALRSLRGDERSTKRSDTRTQAREEPEHRGPEVGEALVPTQTLSSLGTAATADTEPLPFTRGVER